MERVDLEKQFDKALKIIGLQKLELEEVTTDKNKFERWWSDGFDEKRELKERLTIAQETAKEANRILSEMFEVIPENWQQEIAELQNKLCKTYE
jgi:hypothetical protein